jgi:nicotinate-nucleotide adenylyltransferase
MKHRLALFGGTFNPIHVGHLRLAEDVREQFNIDRVLFIPTNIPPHKSVDAHIEPKHRLNMVQLAIEGNDSFNCDDVELRRGGNSYTIDTVEYVYEQYAFDGRPYFILGSDLMPEIGTWKSIERLAGLVHFIVLIRADYPFREESCSGIMGLSWHRFNGRKIQVNSTEIRHIMGRGASIRYLVTERVLQYIRDHELYGENTG